MLLSQTLLLKKEPAGTLRSLDELFALASAMEKEAADRYAGLAEEMRLQKRDDLQAVFAELADAEREHIESVTSWSQSRRGQAPDPMLVRWEVPETFDVEASAEITGSRLMTPYRALSMAVRNEERAFAFWSYVAAFAVDPEIQKAAETMAREELAHVSTLRKQRRGAYHRERTAAPSSSSGERVDAAALERCLATRIAEIEATLQDAPRNRARELREEATRIAVRAAGLVSFPATLEKSDAQSIAEALTEGYLEGAERSDNPERLESLQWLAERAIARLAWLRSLARPANPD